MTQYALEGQAPPGRQRKAFEQGLKNTDELI
jgi:hypothetical protein